jgi:3,4-dihydroxy 2-butanone 4-phosphate synthase/GTP cyclohydrolase II
LYRSRDYPIERLLYGSGSVRFTKKELKLGSSKPFTHAFVLGVCVLPCFQHLGRNQLSFGKSLTRGLFCRISATPLIPTDELLRDMKNQVSAHIPTTWGDFYVHAYAQRPVDPLPHLAIVHPDYQLNPVPLVRVHSECLTGDLLGSTRCDCGEQLHRSLDMIYRQKGVLLYLRQEGRGIGLINKLRAYNLQDGGLNTVDANHQLGFEADERSYEIAALILRDLGIDRIRLLTNNPRKVASLKQDGIEIVERVSIQVIPSDENADYLRTKKDILGHLLD